MPAFIPSNCGSNVTCGTCLADIFDSRYEMEIVFAESIWCRQPYNTPAWKYGNNLHNTGIQKVHIFADSNCIINSYFDMGTNCQ